jgi:hypothetical protein
MKVATAAKGGISMKRLLDWSAFWVATFNVWLPKVVVLLSAIWLGTRIYEYVKQKVLKWRAERAGIEFKEEQIPG